MRERSKDLSPREYLTGFQQDLPEGDGYPHLVGRVLCGKSLEDFQTLSDDPDRRLVLMLDGQALAQLRGISGYSLLMKIGWMPEYAAWKIKQGYRIKLLVCRKDQAIFLADWDNVMRLVAETYPEIGDRLQRWLPLLKSKSFTDIEREYGYSMSAVNRIGKEHPAYMTYDRYLVAPDTLASVRAFLYFSIHLREQYAGDGCTRHEDGSPGVFEYIVVNRPISQLNDSALADITVSIP